MPESGWASSSVTLPKPTLIALKLNVFFAPGSTAPNESVSGLTASSGWPTTRRIIGTTSSPGGARSGESSGDASV